MPRVPSEAYLALIHFAQRDEIVHGARSRPRPARDTGEVVRGINLNVPIGVVTVSSSIRRIIGGVVAGNIAPPHGGVEPRVPPAVVGQKYGERAFAVGNDQLQT